MAGLSAASLLAAGTWMGASRFATAAAPAAQASSTIEIAPEAAPQAASAGAAFRAFALPEESLAPAKADRPLRATAVGEAAGARRTSPSPLSADAFKRRFPAVSMAAPELASRFVMTRLLERPKADEVRTAFAQEPALRLGEAAVFHPLKPAARLTPAEALAAAAGIAPKAEQPAPVVLASLPDPATEALSDELSDHAALPDSVAAPTARPRMPAAPRTAARAPAQAQAPDDSVPGVFAAAPSARAMSPRVSGVVESAKPAVTLAYARPDDPADDSVLKPKIPWPGAAKRVAYYDISAGVVHMPNGEKLEAHSGRGRMRDNPSFAHVKMRGPTPPSTYKLSMREALFHGVEAIRLTPVNGVAPHGRVGLLAHTYLLRNAPPGDSSGCVVFKDYKRFLNAFKRGEVSQMVVVARMSGAPALAAKFASLMPRSR